MPRVEERCCYLCGKKIEGFTYVHRYMKRVYDFAVQARLGKPVYEDIGFQRVCVKCANNTPCGYIKIT